MIDLKPEQLKIIKAILAQHVPECTVWAFGSRINEQARAYSDLDLVIIDKNPLPQPRMNRLQEAFEYSDLPFRVDIMAWHALSESFQRVIEAHYEVIQNS